MGRGFRKLLPRRGLCELCEKIRLPIDTAFKQCLMERAGAVDDDEERCPPAGRRGGRGVSVGRGPRRPATVDAGLRVAEPGAVGVYGSARISSPLRNGALPCGTARTGVERPGRYAWHTDCGRLKEEAVQRCRPRALK